jgi:outer membrane protein assembly factor BamB
MENKGFVFAVVLCLLLSFAFVQLVSTQTAYTNDGLSWPSWRRDPGNTGYNEVPAPDTNQTAWVNSVGPGNGAARGGGAFPAAVAYEKIFIGSEDGVLYALDEHNGDVVWKQTIREGWNLFCPTVAHNTVYIVSDAGELVALNEKTGDVAWRKNFPASPSINVDNDRLFIAAYNGTFYCVNATSGEALWSRNLTISDYRTYIITHPAMVDGRVFVGPICLNETDGTTLWTLTLNGQELGIAANNFPAVTDGKVVIGIGDTMYALNELDGSVLWTRQIGGDVMLTPPAVANDRVFVTSSADGNLYCLNAQTGEMVWKQAVGSGTITRLASTPVVANGKVYVNLNNADWGVMCLDANNGTVIWSYATAGPAAQPLIADGAVIVTLEHDPQVYVFGQTSASDQTFWLYLTLALAAIVAAGVIGVWLARRAKNKPEKQVTPTSP